MTGNQPISRNSNWHHHLDWSLQTLALKHPIPTEHIVWVFADFRADRQLYFKLPLISPYLFQVSNEMVNFTFHLLEYCLKQKYITGKLLTGA